MSPIPAMDLDVRWLPKGGVFVPDPAFGGLRYLWGFRPGLYLLPRDLDPDYHLRADGEWRAVVTLPHEVVEFEGYGVPVFEGDVERIAWKRERALYCRSRKTRI